MMHQFPPQIKIALLFTLFLIPLLSATTQFGYEQIKVFFFIICLTICGGIWLIYSSKYKVKTIWTPIKKAAALFIAILFLTSILGIDKWSSFLGGQPYFQGLIFYAYLYLFFLIVSWSKIKFEYWIYVLVGSSTLVGILAIKDWILINLFHQSIPTYADRVVSTFGQPNFYSGFILLTIPFILYLLGSKGVAFRGWIMVGFIIAVLAIILSQSKTAILLLFGLLIFWLLRDITRKKLLISLVITIIVVVSTSFAWLSVKEVLEPIFSKNPDLTKVSVENRIYIWPVAIKIILEQPITGYGLENIQPAFSHYFIFKKHVLFEENLNISPILISFKELNINRTHNYVLDLFLFSGVVGVLIWIYLIILLFKKLKQISHGRGKNVYLVSLVVYLIWIQFQNQSMVHLLYFWLITGVIDSS